MPAVRSSSSGAAPSAARTIDAKGRLREAERLISVGRTTEAEALVQPLLAHQAHRASAAGLLAITGLAAGRIEAAIAHARDAAERAPNVARHHFVLGRVLKALGDRETAASAYRVALEVDPRYAEAMVSLGILLKDSGDLAGAIELYDRALTLRPGLAAAHANRAHALALQAERRLKDGVDVRPDEAVLDAQGRAVSFDPRNAALHRNYGVMLRQARRLPEAMEAFNQALTLSPSDVEACLGLGATLNELGGIALERECYLKWLGLNPTNAPVMRALAGALTLLGDADVALGWAEKALAIEPDPVGLMQCASVMQQLRRMPLSLAYSRRALDDAGRPAEMYPPHLLGLNYLHDDPAVIEAEHAEFGERVGKTLSRIPRRAREAGDRLRVGYVSGDFVRHSVAYFMEPLLEHHDTARFDIACYHNNARTDHITSRLKSHGHRWVECAGLSDEAMARQIRADGVDVLVDLSGPTARSRLLMFGLAPAPVQVAFLGYPTRSGVQTIDWRITDGVIDPEGMPAVKTERPLRLAHTMYCFRPDAAPPLATPPSLATGCITFGSFNNTAKITDRTLALWAGAMAAVPGSRLLLKAASMSQVSVREGILGEMARHGVEASRLALHARRDDDLDHLSLYNEFDIALDTVPYNGATTTCEALWMGLPLVTLRGCTHAGRMGASILEAIGKPEWIAGDSSGFAAAAAALAAEPGVLSAWRANARKHLNTTPLLDHVGFTRRFEAALDEAWSTPELPSA